MSIKETPSDLRGYDIDNIDEQQEKYYIMPKTKVSKRILDCYNEYKEKEGYDI